MAAAQQPWHHPSYPVSGSILICSLEGHFYLLPDIPNAFEFVGAQGVMEAASDLSYMRARFFSSHSGRFTSPDPIGILGGQVNQYTYVNNAPTRYIDPLGLDWVDYTLPIGGGLLPKLPGSLIGLAPTGNGKEMGQGLKVLLDDMPNCGSPGLGGLNARRYAEYLPGGGGGAGGCGDSGATPQAPPGQEGGKGDSGTVGAVDPNEKTATGGFGPQNFVGRDSIVPYRIDFENDPSATAPAQRVVITDPLDSRLDAKTLNFTRFGFGDVLVDIPVGRQYFQTTIPFPVEQGQQPFDVDVELSVNTATGMVRAVFQSIDPETSLPPDVLTGFLPPEDGNGQGQGFFEFTIDLMDGLASGTEIRNIAAIVFDANPPIFTNQVEPLDPSKGTDPDKEALITIDAINPTSSVVALSPTTETLEFTVSWSGEDDANGSGIKSYDIYVSKDGGPFELWLDDTPETSVLFSGIDLSTYAFVSVAMDNVRQRELQTLFADTSTTIDIPKPPVAMPGGPYSATEGSVVTFDGSASFDPNNDIVMYQWDFDYDGITFDVDQTGASPQVLFRDNQPARLVALRVTDSKGLFSISSVTLQIDNVRPQITYADVVGALEEHQPVVVDLTFVDPGIEDIHKVRIDWGDGTSNTYDVELGSRQLTVQHVFTDLPNYDGPVAFTVTAVVLDDIEQSEPLEIPIEVTPVNRPPVILDQEFTFAEGTADDTILGAVTNLDPDLFESVPDEQYFLIVGGNDQGVFAIDDSGVLSVANGALVDFETQSTYEIVVQVTDGGGLQDTSVVSVEVENSPEIVGLIIDDGSGQRSMIRSLKIDFDAIVEVDTSSIILETDAGVVLPVTYQVTEFAGNTRVMITMTSPEYLNGSLSDGDYRLRTLRAAASIDNREMSGDRVDEFYRYFGDISGDGSVNLSDLPGFRNAFGRPVDDDEAVDLFDFNGDGFVNLFDFIQFRGRFGTSRN